jgi:sugar lactone lactonase YvrE
MSTIAQVGDFKLLWGESLRWDDQRRRLYFVDCATQTLHWLEGGEPPLQSLKLPSLPTGIALTDDGRLVVALDGGLHLVNVDAQRVELLSAYPEGLGTRANDAAADLDGNLVTGTLNIGPGPGSYWWYSSTEGWRLLDKGNGPVVLEDDGQQTLVFADTPASAIYAYDYDGKTGNAGPRRLFADTSQLGGMPDGACADADGGVWGCVLGSGKIARHKDGVVDEIVDTGVELPSDVTFGGADLSRMYFVSIAVSLPEIEVTSPNAGALMVVDGTSYTGRVEPRFRLSD